MKKIPFILVTGFLGSGKTTLLLDILKKYSDKHRIAIVQNEFSPGHFDGTLLKEGNHSFNLLEINNGSVFCACLLSNFIERLEPFIEEAHPDIILLEATGLADPVSLGQILHSDHLSDKIYLAASWCIVDSANFFRISETVSRVLHQIRIADTIWINKTDLNKNTAPIRKRILELNPFAVIIESEYCSTHLTDLDILIHQNRSSHIDPFENESEPRPDIGSCVVRSSRYFDQDSVETFIRGSLEQLIRIKGFIRLNSNETLVIQGVFENLETKTIQNYSGPTELIALGKGLNNLEFSKQFLALQSNRKHA